MNICNDEVNKDLDEEETKLSVVKKKQMYILIVKKKHIVISVIKKKQIDISIGKKKHDFEEIHSYNNREKKTVGMQRLGKFNRYSYQL